MAQSQGYDFDEVQLKRDCYSPVAHGRVENEQTKVREGVLVVLEGKRSLPMHITYLPPYHPIDPVVQSEVTGNEKAEPVQNKHNKQFKIDLKCAWHFYYALILALGFAVTPVLRYSALKLGVNCIIEKSGILEEAYVYKIFKVSGYSLFPSLEIFGAKMIPMLSEVKTHQERLNIWCSASMH